MLCGDAIVMAPAAVSVDSITSAVNIYVLLALIQDVLTSIPAKDNKGQLRSESVV